MVPCEPLMNSKFKKIKTKSKNYETFWGPKNYWNFLGSNMLKCARCNENFVLKWDRTGSCKNFVIFLNFFFKFTIHRAVLWRSNPVNGVKSGLEPNLFGFETWGTKCIPKNLEGPSLYFWGTWGTKNILFFKKKSYKQIAAK